MRETDLGKLGECDLTIAGLRLWVHGREFQDSEDYWDGNWLRVSGLCRYPGAWVVIEGPIVHLGEISGFLTEVELANRTLEGVATLACIEPNLKAELVLDRKGHVAITIDVTPDHMNQVHRFLDKVDHTYLPEIISSCRTLLAKYPLRGTSD